jgi:hypothetical protein
MADTTIRISDLPAGWTDLYARIENDQGAVWNGTAYVAFVVANVVTYRVALSEVPAASGRYSVAFPGSPAGTYSWGLYKGPGTVSDPRYEGPVFGVWDGAKFTSKTGGGVSSTLTALGRLQATMDSYLTVTPAAIVTDVGPTTGTFVVSLADGSAVPATFVWRGNSVWFKTGTMLGGKYPIATYSRLTATTARLTFSPLLPLAPANGDLLLIA